MYIHIFIFLSICFKIEKSTTIDIAFPTKNRGGSKLASIFKWYHVGEIFLQGWHDSSRGFFVEISVTVFKEWVKPSSGSSGAAVAQKVP